MKTPAQAAAEFRREVCSLTFDILTYESDTYSFAALKPTPAEVETMVSDLMTAAARRLRLRLDGAQLAAALSAVRD